VAPSACNSHGLCHFVVTDGNAEAAVRNPVACVMVADVKTADSITYKFTFKQANIKLN
jgi:hypothetical protein